MININFRAPTPIYEQVRDNYRNLILSGVLPEGYKMPSVRELASELAINPNTIQRAYRELEAEGYKLRRRELEGQFVALAGELRALGADDAALMELIKGGETK